VTDARLSILGNGDGRLLHLSGEVDSATLPQLERRLAESVAKAADLTLDLSELTFMDSSGLRLLIEVAHQLEGSGKLILLAPSGIVRRVLELTQLDRIPNLEVR
jgi:anti-anti-sigma factor